MVTIDESKLKRLRRRRGTRPSTSSYLSFGTKSTVCLALFAMVYFISMMFFQPMLHDETKIEHFKHVKENIISRKNEIVGKMKDEGRAWRKEIQRVRERDRVGIDKELMDKAWQQFLNDKHQGTKEKSVDQSDFERVKVKTVRNGVKDNQDDKPTTGFVVLGMHRSGTSMLSGLLVEGFGYKVGAPLIQPHFDNEKGFFELLPAVLQNDEFMYEQNVNWAANVGKYDYKRALEETKNGNIPTEKLQKVLNILNNPDYTPWLQKDPRMCITLRTWLPFLNSKPAVIFTYRHPLEVAMSLHKRESGFTILRGLRLWILYNKAAIRNSADLCRVFSSNVAVLSNPFAETQRIVHELTHNCGVPTPPMEITQDIVEDFVDPNLQHNKRKNDEESNKKVLETRGDCQIQDYDSLLEESDRAMRKKEMNMYLIAMRIYCDFQSGKAYSDDYEWPEVS